MSTVNQHYTYAYSQPDDYRFSHDSVFLARQAFEYVKAHNLMPTAGLDLCSGCGIIGLDYLIHCRNENYPVPGNFSFLEVQDTYLPHFQKNLAGINPETSCEFVQKNYQELLSPEYKEQFDLILCNPPYFRAGQGKMSPSEFKNRCRFFLDSDYETLIRALYHSLKPQGHVFLLLRDLQEHKWNPLAELKLLLPSASVELLTPIRGTDCVLIKR